MRILKILLLSMVVALAGCADDEGDGGEATNPPPADTTPPDEGAGDANDTPDEGANETQDEEETPPPAPAEVHTSSYNFADSPTEDTAEPFTVPEGHTTMYLNVTFTPTGVGVANSASVTIAGPNGGSATCTPTTPLAEEEVCSQEVAAEAGEWTLTYSGSGTLSAAVGITAA